MARQKKIEIAGDLAALVEKSIAEVKPNMKPKVARAKGEKRIPMGRVFNADGTVALIGREPETVKTYMDGFVQLTNRSRSGYDNFWSKHDGFTNADKFRTISVQGAAKMIAVLTYQLHRIIAQGGPASDEAKAALKGLEGYRKIATQDATAEVSQQQHEHSQLALNAAFDKLVESLGGDRKAAREKLSKYAADNGLELPPEAAPAAEAENAEAETAEAETAEDAPAAETAEANV